jgi:hypothetical protein
MASRNRRWRFAILLSAVVLLAGWVSIDLWAPWHSSLRNFDGHGVARLETAMWRSYYDRHSVRLFSELSQLLRKQYHVPFWRSYVGAYHAARAAVVFQAGHNRAEYERALPDLESFYALIRQGSDVPFDVEKVARLELEWWIVHREPTQYAPGELERALADLQSEIYRQPPEWFTSHAKTRAEAMLLRDAGAAAGAVSESNWDRIGELLDTSWVSLQKAVSQ